jgi:hypothetical protein
MAGMHLNFCLKLAGGRIILVVLSDASPIGIAAYAVEQRYGP